MERIKKDDTVIVLTGKDRGKEGRVLSRVEKDGKVKFLVEGINLVKKHQKPNPAAGQAGGIIEKEMPIAVSNIALVNPATGKADKVGFKVLEDGKKVRVFKSNGEVVSA